MFTSIKRRDGSIVPFDATRISTVIAKAGRFTKEFDDATAHKLMIKVVSIAEQTIADIPTVEVIQDIIEEVLLQSMYRATAKHYIINNISIDTKSDKETRDVFICHASEDKKSIVEPLVRELEKEGITYWYDRIDIPWGESLTHKVNEGLRVSIYAIVVLTKNFLNKPWPRRELDAALNIEARRGATMVLPLLCGDEHERIEIIEMLPLLNDKRYIVWDHGADMIISELKVLLKK